jgi:hypothetical protein
MKTFLKVNIILVLVSLMLAACSLPPFGGGRRITPSDTVIRETREASGFTGVDMGTFGKVVLIQGEVESLVVSGSDNLVPLVETYVRDGILYIKPIEEFYVVSFTEENMLTFTVTAREIDSMTISGIGDLEMESLTTPSLTVLVSGGGYLQINQLTTDDLTIALSGTGTVELAGEAAQANIDMPGLGDVNMADLKIQTANVKLSGMGGATLWVTDQLTGEISGVGDVSYYGSPKTDVRTQGLGEFTALGTK